MKEGWYVVNAEGDWRARSLVAPENWYLCTGLKNLGQRQSPSELYLGASAHKQDKKYGNPKARL